MGVGKLCGRRCTGTAVASVVGGVGAVGGVLVVRLETKCGLGLSENAKPVLRLVVKFLLWWLAVICLELKVIAEVFAEVHGSVKVLDVVESWKWIGWRNVSCVVVENECVIGIWM